MHRKPNCICQFAKTAKKCFEIVFVAKCILVLTKMLLIMKKEKLSFYNNSTKNDYLMKYTGMEFGSFVKFNQNAIFAKYDKVLAKYASSKCYFLILFIFNKILKKIVTSQRFKFTKHLKMSLVKLHI